MTDQELIKMLSDALDDELMFCHNSGAELSEMSIAALEAWEKEGYGKSSALDSIRNEKKLLEEKSKT